MGADGLVVYGECDLHRPAVPPRSRLFHLEPVGVGTPETESLTGYVARLAEAHGVRVRDLVLHEILPLLDRPHLAATRDPALLSAFWRNETRALNGTRTLARTMVRALEILTGRRDLRFLTLLTWSEILPVQQLQRPTRAWCPVCYEERRRAGRAVHEPLLWTLAPVTACARHGRRLEEHCAACGRASPVLGARSRPGHCARRAGWLGRAADTEQPAPAPLTDEERRAHAWLERALGELIAAAPDLPAPPRREQLVRAIDASVAHVAAGNRRGWARQLGLGLETAAGWRDGRTIPSPGLLLQACGALGTTPLRLLQATSATRAGPPRAACRPPSFRVAPVGTGPRPNARPCVRRWTRSWRATSSHPRRCGTSPSGSARPDRTCATTCPICAARSPRATSTTSERRAASDGSSCATRSAGRRTSCTPRGPTPAATASPTSSASRPPCWAGSHGRRGGRRCGSSAGKPEAAQECG